MRHRYWNQGNFSTQQNWKGLAGKKQQQQNTCLLGKSMAIWGYESLWEETYVFDTDDIHEALLIQHLYRSYLFESDHE